MAKKEKPKQARVTFYVDEEVLQYFQELGVIEERPYSPLMSRVLREYVIEAKATDKYLNATPDQQRIMEQGE